MVNKCIFHTNVWRITQKRMFKLDIAWDILQVTWFWVERSKVNVRVRVNSNTAWVRTL